MVTLSNRSKTKLHLSHIANNTIYWNPIVLFTSMHSGESVHFGEGGVGGGGLNRSNLWPQTHTHIFPRILQTHYVHKVEEKTFTAFQCKAHPSALYYVIIIAEHRCWMDLFHCASQACVWYELILYYVWDQKHPHTDIPVRALYRET